jgi:Spy/CpxP family protein refolding chaperone
MKYSKYIFCRILISSLLAIALPLASKADTQSGESAYHMYAKPFPNERQSMNYYRHDRDSFYFPPEVNLTEIQHDQIFSIKHKQETLIYEQSKIVRKAHLELHNFVASDKYDDENAKVITDRLGKALGNIKFLRDEASHR